MPSTSTSASVDACQTSKASPTASFAAAVGWATQVIGVDLKTIPNVAAWLGRCMGREAAKAMQ